MRKIILTVIIAIVIVFIGLVIYTNDMQMNESLELRVPVLTKREVIEDQEKDIFYNEEVRKIYLSKSQIKRILKEIENNSNWKNTNIDERLNERMNFYTREGIYSKIPYIENKYWIFTNRSRAIEDKHSIDELLSDMYYAVSFGILDIDNNILYYYQYDR